jgi:hypothetical protein
VIGTGTCALPVMKEVKQEAKRRKIKLLILPTARAIRALKENLDETNAILAYHVLSNLPNFLQRPVPHRKALLVHHKGTIHIARLIA